MPIDNLNAILPNDLPLPEMTISGRGKIAALLPACARFGIRGILVHGPTFRVSGGLDPIRATCPADVSFETWEHNGGEPTLDHVAALLAVARQQRAQWIAAVGGGSVIDLAKACSGLYYTRRPVRAYHDGAPIDAPPLSFAAVPTTAGSGAEATVNAVLTNTSTGGKKSIRGASLMARLIVLDGDLLATCPPRVIAHSGMDALTQAVEAYTSRHSTWLSDTLALQGLRLIAGNLHRVFTGERGDAAQHLLTGSYLTGMALSLARLGVVHGLAHPLGVSYHAPHGLVCAVCLPHAIEFNRPAIGAKYAAISEAIGEDLQSAVANLLTTLSIASPFANQRLQDADRIIEETLASGSTQANIRTVTRADVHWFLERLFGYS